MALHAVVIGAGWAGEGHTHALRAADVEVVALCGRTPEPAKAMAASLGIDAVYFDWKEALEKLRPDIVTIATPAAPHRMMAEFAAQLGCHIMCEKPLALNAGGARDMLAAVEQAGVKHAYGSTSRYAPACIYARQLLREGLIGALQEIESLAHLQIPPLLPYCWLHQLALGGGTLNNLFIHKLGQVLFITGGRVTAVSGEGRPLLAQAPVGAPIHDFRTLFGQMVVPDATTEWRPVDADTAYTVLAHIELPDATAISALFKCSVPAHARHPGYLALYGQQGTLYLRGANAPESIEHFDAATGEWRELPIPAQISALIPQVEDPTQRDWNYLFRKFVADVEESGDSASYPTFYDGWLHNEVVDIVRSGDTWADLPPTPLIAGT